VIAIDRLTGDPMSPEVVDCSVTTTFLSQRSSSKLKTKSHLCVESSALYEPLMVAVFSVVKIQLRLANNCISTTQFGTTTDARVYNDAASELNNQSTERDFNLQSSLF
jgi:hypothetical protein